MLLTEHKFRRVIRKTIIENNYRVNERFYRQLNRNLMNEVSMNSIKKSFSSVKNAFKKGSVNKKSIVPKAKKASFIIKSIALMSLLNAAAVGKTLESGHFNQLNKTLDGIEQIAKSIEGNAGEGLDAIVSAQEYVDVLSDAAIGGDLTPEDMSNILATANKIKAVNKQDEEMKNTMKDLQRELDQFNAKYEEGQEDFGEVLDDTLEAMTGQIHVGGESLDDLGI